MTDPIPSERLEIVRAVPRPVPDPAAVAAGAPLRAALLAQLDAVERHRATVAAGTAAPSAARGWDADFPPELRAYGWWCNAVLQSAIGVEGGPLAGRYFRHAAILLLSFAELRDPALLDIYVSGIPWAGLAGPQHTPQSREE